MNQSTVFFGVFGSRNYPKIEVVSHEVGAAKIPCRWCVGDGQPIGCVACKGTGSMWVGI